jgi:hypothetical protein
MNAQPWRVIVVRDKAFVVELEKEAMNNLKAESAELYERIVLRGGKLFYNASAAIFLPIASGMELDCGIVSENIAIAASSLGLGSLICGLARFAFTGSKAVGFKSRLKFPEGYSFGIAVLPGYPAVATAPHLPDKGKIIFVD